VEGVRLLAFLGMGDVEIQEFLEERKTSGSIRNKQDQEDDWKGLYREFEKTSRLSSDLGGMGLFHDDEVELDAEFSPPKGPMICGLEELLHLSAEKRKPPGLAERRIQVTGRRLPKFIPPPWKSRQRRSHEVDMVPEKKCKGNRIQIVEDTWPDISGIGVVPVGVPDAGEERAE
jgi:hypothetical protein